MSITIQSAKPANYRQAQNHLSTIQFINSGGCGIAALALYRWRKAHDMRVNGFAFLYDDAWDLEHNQKAIQASQLSKMETPSHVALIVDKKLHDSEGDSANKTCKHITCIQPGITEATLLYLINQPHRWHHRFNRKLSIPEIESQLGVDLSDIEY